MDMDLGHAVGKATETRFRTLLSTRVSYTPGWYLRTVKAANEWDHRGIDFFVYIAHKEGGRPVKVPVQIKSSEDGASEFRRRHTRRQVANILVFVVRRSISDEDVRRMTYARLLQIYASGKRFDEYYEKELAKAEARWRRTT